YTNLDDKALGYIVQLPLLQILDLDSCNKITANGFQQLQLLKNIRELYLKETAVDDKALQSLRGYVHLQILDLSSCANITSIGIDGFTQVSSAKNLRHLSFTGIRVDEYVLKRIVTVFSNLKVIDFDYRDEGNYGEAL